jgi:hypothetical protein
MSTTVLQALHCCTASRQVLQTCDMLQMMRYGGICCDFWVADGSRERQCLLLAGARISYIFLRKRSKNFDV